MTVNTFEFVGTLWTTTLLAAWWREQRAPGMSWLVGSAIPACVDDFGTLVCEGFPWGHEETRRRLIADGFPVADYSGR